MTDGKKSARISALIVVGGLVVGAGLLLGAGMSVAMLMAAFDQVGTASADTRAAVLSDGISRAIWGGAGCCGSTSLVGVGLMGFGVWRAYADKRTTPASHSSRE